MPENKLPQETELEKALRRVESLFAYLETERNCFDSFDYFTMRMMVVEIKILLQSVRKQYES